LKKRAFLSWGSAIGLLLALAGAAFAQSQETFTGQERDLWLPYAASDYSGEVDYLYRAIFWLTTGMFVLTEGLLIAFCILYRRRPGHRSTYNHGNNAAEITWTVVPAAILLGLAIWQIPTWNLIKKPDWKALAKEPNVTVVDVLGEQFKWQIRYPGSKQKHGGEYDYTTTSLVHIPFGDKALFNLRSKDVIHSLFIPHMRVKQDVVPGLRQRLWFKPSRYFLVKLREENGQPVSLVQDGTIYVGENNKWVKKPLMLQPRVWVTDDKDFEPNGRFFNKRVAVSAVEHYIEKDGLYDAYPVQAKKIRTLLKGKIETGKEWKECDYALGVFEIACAELCGEGHHTMRGFLVVEPRTAYEEWIKAESADAGEPIASWNYWKD
jgi:cytochrome c oxidase subunit 2